MPGAPTKEPPHPKVSGPGTSCTVHPSTLPWISRLHGSYDGMVEHEGPNPTSTPRHHIAVNVGPVGQGSQGVWAQDAPELLWRIDLMWELSERLGWPGCGQARTAWLRRPGTTSGVRSIPQRHRCPAEGGQTPVWGLIWNPPGAHLSPSRVCPLPGDGKGLYCH